MNSRILAGFVILACICLLLSAAPTLAQGAPNAACGLPDGGDGSNTELVAGTYTLNQDCTQSWSLNAYSGVIIIRGNGHTIFAPSDRGFITTEGTSTLVMENVTIDNQGAGAETATSMFSINAPGSIRLTNVTIQNHRGVGALYITNEDGIATSTVTSTLTNVTIKDMRNPPAGRIYERSHGLITLGAHIVVNVSGSRFINIESKNRAPLYAWDRSIINVRNTVFRDNKAAAHILARNNGIVNINEGVVFSGTGTNFDYLDRRIDIEDDTYTGNINVKPPPPSPEDDGDGGGGSGDDEAAPTAVPVIRYSPEQSCKTLQPSIVVSKASSGTSCSRVEGSEIGHPDVIAAMPSLVVDIWGWVTPNTEVCFWATSGSIRFIDTTAIPRTVADLPVFSEEGGLLCATIDGAGQVALVPGTPAPQEQAASAQGAMLSGCMVTLQYSLNFRDAPAGENIGALPSQVKLTALERTDGWFKVDYHGERGWISAAHVEPEGDCG